MYEVKVLRALSNCNSKIMRSTEIWAALASLVLLATIARAHHTCGYAPSSCEVDSVQSAIDSGAQVVTYGDPCFCKESIPYSIQVPKSDPPTLVEKLGSYRYAVDAPPPTQSARCLQLPVKIETPVIHQPCRDCLRGNSYGVTVERKQSSSDPRRFNFDFAIQKPEKIAVQESRRISPLPFLIQRQEEKYEARYSPLPIAVQKPLQIESKSFKLPPLCGKVDRVLIPACDISGCPDCNDILPKKYNPPPPRPCSPCQ